MCSLPTSPLSLPLTDQVSHPVVTYSYAFLGIEQFLTSVPVMAFVLMVVFVDLIVTFCSEVLLTPTEKQNKDVDIFGSV